MPLITPEQALALAPDGASVKAGQGLSSSAKWVSAARTERVLWGECKGSGAQPYRTQVDLTGPAFHCSCPSRKFPCKHGLGLILMFAQQPAALAEGTPPAWVLEWLGKRDAAAEKKEFRTASADAPVDPETLERREAERAKRAGKREERVQAGLADLQLWLSDVIRLGLATAKQQPAQFWDGIASRMIDAQAPGLAQLLREVPAILVSGDNWADRLLEQLGMIQLLIEGYSRLGALPESLQRDVRSAIGWTTSDDEIAALPAVTDEWQVIGQRITEKDRLRVQRTWLFGKETRQPALLLDFAVASQSFMATYASGFGMTADLVFHPSAAPLRAVVRTRKSDASPVNNAAGYAGFEEALNRTARLLSANPFLRRFPWLVESCIPGLEAGKLWLSDKTGARIPLQAAELQGWELLAISGGLPVTISGEWNGSELTLLGVFGAGGFISLIGGTA